jgi:hypothetical protein
VACSQIDRIQIPMTSTYLRCKGHYYARSMDHTPPRTIAVRRYRILYTRDTSILYRCIAVQYTSTLHRPCASVILIDACTDTQQRHTERAELR